jgi:hypothetical protein
MLDALPSIVSANPLVRGWLTTKLGNRPDCAPEPVVHAHSARHAGQSADPGRRERYVDECGHPPRRIP